VLRRPQIFHSQAACEFADGAPAAEALSRAFQEAPPELSNGPRRMAK